MLHRFLRRFSMFELVIMAMLAVLGVASKPVIAPLVHMITGPLFIPGGVVAGGFYMLWIVLARFIVAKTGAATLTCLIQALLVLALGFVGSHGIMSILTYILPGLAIDLTLFILRAPARPHLLFSFIAGVAANLTGTFGVNLVFFRLPPLPLLMALVAGALSGGLGGVIAYHLLQLLAKSPLLHQGNP